ncbi:uncharacterized protein PpBr36_05833 [Pyricularia pennisetigena]|uniref:Uncharacterized protein n=1 Tax=Pyricularia oryzae TaxID=318829 RepID=A0A4P7N7Z5_PYROR|nr:uncharacterized protein PpBr36_05833 [Pyricularia pennisetigena]QBZ58579.1 hypothetical protein PoMZ_03535 [Pyricularia oryzae]TLS22598.1 hypothetical protein PpBr36_05833 [Pyricularia pennisetigena]
MGSNDDRFWTQDNPFSDTWDPKSSDFALVPR